jgi:hypothetical protein
MNKLEKTSLAAGLFFGVTCSPKTDPVVKLVFRYIIGLRKGKTHATKAIQT